MDRLLQPLVELKQQLEEVIRLAGCVSDRDMKPTPKQRNRITKLTDFQLGMCKLIQIISRRLQNAFATTASPTPVESALLDQTNSMAQLFREMLPLPSRSQSYQYVELENNPVVNIKCFVATLSELETEMIATYNRVTDEEKAIETRKKNQVKKAKQREKKNNRTPQQKEESVEAEIKTDSNDAVTEVASVEAEIKTDSNDAVTEVASVEAEIKTESNDAVTEVSCIPDILSMRYSPGERTNYSTAIFKGELKNPVPSNSTAPKSIPVMYFKLEKSLYEMSGYRWADFSIRHPNKYMLSVNGVGKTADEGYFIACETFEEPLANWLKVPAHFGSNNLLPITLRSFFKDVVNGAMFVDKQSNGLLEAELSINDVYIINGQAKFGLLKERSALDVTGTFRNMVRKVYENNPIPVLLDHLLDCMKTAKRWSVTFVTHPVFLTHPQMCTYAKLSYETLRAQAKLLATQWATYLSHLFAYEYGGLDWRDNVKHEALLDVFYFQKQIPPNSGEGKKMEESPKKVEGREVKVGEEVKEKKTAYVNQAWSLLEFYRDLVVHKKGTLTDEQIVLEMNKIAPNFLLLVHEALSKFHIFVTVGDDLTLEEEKQRTRAGL